jgi:hypothetical protein
MKNFKNFSWSLVLSVLLLALALPASAAYPTETIQTDPNYLDFVVGPGSTALEIAPGRSAVLEVMVSNRTGKDREFEIKFSDFVGSSDLASPVILTTEKTVYTFKDYLSVPEKKFFLKNGARARIPVTVSVPAGAEAGGRYASVLVSTVTPVEKSPVGSGETKGGVPLITQTGTLIYVRIPGEVKTEGSLTDFKTNRFWGIYSYGKNVLFDLIFTNTGKIHLRPGGQIAVKNMFGQEVRIIDLETWFVMPGAVRLREVKLVQDEKKDDVFMLGRYTAEAKIVRGYGTEVDTKKIAFWVLPWPLLLLTLIIILFLIWLVRWLLSHLQFRGAPTVNQSGPVSASGTTDQPIK